MFKVIKNQEVIFASSDKEEAKKKRNQLVVEIIRNSNFNYEVVNVIKFKGETTILKDNSKNYKKRKEDIYIYLENL